MARVSSPSCVPRTKTAALTLYMTSCEPEPMLTLQPSPFFRPCILSCNPYTQLIKLGMPAVGPYCRPSARALPLSCVVISSPGLVGERDVNWMDVSGNVVAFGLPASKEIKPGRFSRGYKPRTASKDKWKRLVNFDRRQRYPQLHTGGWACALWQHLREMHCNNPLRDF